MRQKCHRDDIVVFLSLSSFRPSPSVPQRRPVVGAGQTVAQPHRDLLVHTTTPDVHSRHVTRPRSFTAAAIDTQSSVCFGNKSAVCYSYSRFVACVLHVVVSRVVAWVGPEMSMGPFFYIQSNPIHQLTDPIQSNPVFILSAKSSSNMFRNLISFVQLTLHVDS